MEVVKHICKFLDIMLVKKSSLLPFLLNLLSCLQLTSATVESDKTLVICEFPACSLAAYFGRSCFYVKNLNNLNTLRFSA